MLLRFRPLLLPGLLLFCAAPLLLLTRYNQPYWDDYGHATLYRHVGALAAQRVLYQQAGGRFVSNACVTLLNPLSYGWLAGVQLTALLAILSELASIYFVLRTFTTRRLAVWPACWLSLGLWLVFVCTIPDIHSGLYWFAGLVVHQLGCCLLLVVPAAMTRAQQHPARRTAWLALAAGTTLLLAGTSELVILLLGLLLLLASSLCWYRRHYAWGRRWSTLLLLLALGASVLALAPGNHQRLAASAPPWPTSALAFATQLGHGLRLVMWQPVFLTLLVVPVLLTPWVPRLLAGRPPGFHLPLWLSASVLLAGLVGGTTLLSVFISPTTLLARGINVLYWWTLLGWVAACWASLPAAPTALPTFSPSVRALVACLLGVVVAAPTWRAWQEALWEAPRWAAQCDARAVGYRQLQGRHCQLTVPPITHVVPHYVLVRGYDIQPSATHPLNQSVAAYFGLDSVRTAVSWPVPASF